MQFTLRSMFLVTTILAVALAMLRWQSVPGIFLFTVAMGLTLIWLSPWLKRVEVLITGIGLLVAAFMFLYLVGLLMRGH